MAQLDFNEFLEGEFVPSTDDDWGFLRAVVQNLFKPKTPIDDDKLFAGRIDEISQVLDAVYEDGGHAVIFGERGVGKTSLAKIIKKKIAPVISAIHIPEPVSCGRTDDFYTIWGNAFNDFSAGDRTPAQLFRERTNPYEVYNALNGLDSNLFHLFIFDEFDRIQDDNTLYLMADLLKHYSIIHVTSQLLLSALATR